MEIQAPRRIVNNGDKPLLFLAGSIGGGAEQWQKKAIELIEKEAPNRFVILNPRRDDWDSTWEQTFENPHFSQQVNWELHGIEKAEFVLLYFDPKTQSPITLIELGKLSECSNSKTLVVCPEGFWKKGNVDIVCDRAGIPQFDTLEDAIESLLERTIYYDDDNDIPGIDVKID